MSHLSESLTRLAAQYPERRADLDELIGSPDAVRRMLDGTRDADLYEATLLAAYYRKPIGCFIRVGRTS